MTDRASETTRGLLRRVAVAFASVVCLTASAAGAQEVPVIQARSNQPVYTYDLLVNQLLINDPVAFAMQHQQQLNVTKAQRDSLRQFERDLKQQRSAILREAEELLSRPLPSRSQQFDPLELPAPARAGYIAMMEATLSYGPRVNALFDNTQLAVLAELRAEWVPPQPKAGARKAAFKVEQVSSPGGRPPM
jgi:hypothetical protein